MKCARIGCDTDATTAVGVLFFPPVAVSLFYQTNKPLTRMIFGLDLCAQHAAEMKPSDLLDEEKLRAIARTVEQGTGTTVDLLRTKVVPVAYDDPDYLMYVKQRGRRV